MRRDVVWGIKTKPGGVVPAEHIYAFTISLTANSAREKAEKMWRNDWRRLYREGYRCVKVEIREVGN